MLNLQHIDHVAIAVRDIARSIDWYTKTLGLEHRSVWEGEPQSLYAGETAVALFRSRERASRCRLRTKRSG
jgi:catechol 2,3-dioxygenase-like lactoylglutathione lyase family enzyme